LAVDLSEHPHQRFLEKEDLVQNLYERARKAALDRRTRVHQELADTLRAHGVAGLFIDPEGTLVSCLSRPLRSSSRRGTAFHHAHLPEDLFETITRSLAEGVGVASTARIQKVDKKTVLKVLARSADHVAKVTRALLEGVAVSECQLDEMWSFIGKKEGNLDPVEKIEACLSG